MMNTAAELRKFSDNQALEKAIKAVTNALIEEPLGLEISQIMNNCRLSNKTTKTVLSIINAKNNNGVWGLGERIEPKEEVNSQTIPATKEVQTMPATKKEQPVVQESYLKRLIELFKKNPEGISLENILKEMGGNRQRFDSELWAVRKHHFPVHRDLGLYIPLLDKKPDEKPTKESAPKSEQAISEVEKADPTTKSINPESQEIQEKVVEFRAMVQQRIVVTKEVILNSEQLDNVLKNIFGLDTITWSTVGDKVQAHLTQTQVA